MATATYASLTGVDTMSSMRREALVMEHLPQVRLIAGRIHDRLPESVSLDDLISCGVIGLLAAIDNYDPSRNTKLNTYAEHKIRGAILDSLRQTDWAPRDFRKRSRLIEAAIHGLKQQLGREPEAEEIALELGVALEEYQEWLADIRSLEIQSLEVMDEHEEGFDLLRVIWDDEEQWPEQIVMRKELEDMVARAIDAMPPREKTVLSLYYQEELTHREIAEVLGVHLSRVGQLRTQAILRLRTVLSKAGLPRAAAARNTK